MAEALAIAFELRPNWAWKPAEAVAQPLRPGPPPSCWTPDRRIGRSNDQEIARPVRVATAGPAPYPATTKHREERGASFISVP